jgi:hypothetical protein
MSKIELFKEANIAKFATDHRWAGIVTLYADLFNSTEDRNSFIIDVADFDLALAARCLQNSVDRNTSMEAEVLSKAARKFDNRSKDDYGVLYSEFIAVIMIKPINSDMINNFICMEAFQKRRHFKTTSQYIVNVLSIDDLLEMLSVVRPVNKSLFISSVIKGTYRRLITSNDGENIEKLIFTVMRLGYKINSILESLCSRGIRLGRLRSVVEYMYSKNLYSIRRNGFNADRHPFKLMLCVLRFTELELREILRKQ